jgi:CCR4-NOT transcription complex subunit 7/8
MTKIVEIWGENFTEALPRIQNCIQKSSLVAMDTEFPGTVNKPFQVIEKVGDMYFQILRRNVDMLQLIQLGISFANEIEGKIAITESLQFNFNFNLSRHMFAQDSIDLLLRSGVDFQNHKKSGIKIETFVNMLRNSSLIFNENIYWISFHSGYDFGYLLKILTNKFLPKNRIEFLKLIEIHFPNFYDVKYLNLFSGNFVGGLNKLAEKLQIERIGKLHQAGSDSLLTLFVFEKLKKFYFNGFIEKRFKGILFGLNNKELDNCSAENEYNDEEISNYIIQ